MRCVARSAILLEPHVIGIHIIHFRPQEIAYHRSVVLAVDGYGNASFWKKYGSMIPPDQNPHQTVTFSGYIWSWCISRGLVPNSTILLVHISIHPKMGLIAKDNLFGEIWVNFQLLQNPANTRRCLPWSFILSSWVS